MGKYQIKIHVRLEIHTAHAGTGVNKSHRLMRTHLAIFFADRGDVAVLKTQVIKSPNLMGWLYWRFAAINVENRGKEFNRRYLTCQISAILYANCGDRRISQSLHRAHLAIFADRGDRRIKSPAVSLALLLLRYELLCGRQESSNIVHLELFSWLNTDWD